MLSTLRSCAAFNLKLRPAAASAFSSSFHNNFLNPALTSPPYLTKIASRCVSIRLFSVNKQSNQKKAQKKELQDSVNHRGAKKKKQANEAVSVEDEDCIDGLVIERLGDRLLVMPLDEAVPQRPQHYLCMQRNVLAAQHVVPGDRVSFKLDAAATTATPDSTSSTSSMNNHTVGMVSAVQTRLNVLQRTAIGSSVHKVVLKNIAANIDVLCVLVSSRPLVPLHTIDNYLTYAEIMQIPKVMLLVNKADLPDAEELFRSLQFYRKSPLHVELLMTSVQTKQGIEELLEKIRSKTTIFVGQSGVGKSSLIRCLLPSQHDEELIRVGDLVKNDLYGAHTTSNARLYRIPLPQDTANTDTYLIDSPGIRELSVAQFPPTDIIAGFREIAEASHDCKFRNCNHFLNDVREVSTLIEDEPALRNCAVIRGLQQGSIERHRFDSLRHLMEQSLRR